MKAGALASTWFLGWGVLALALLALHSFGLLGVAWRLAFLYAVVVPVAVCAVFAAALLSISGSLGWWDWLEERRRADEQRQESQRAAREQREKEGAQIGL